MDYYIFVLGYDLLHDDLDGIECDVAYHICTRIFLDFLESLEDEFYNCSTYGALSGYVISHREEIKAMIEAER